MNEDRKDGIVYRAQVAHVTFFIKMHETVAGPWYEVFAESEKEGRREIDTRIYDYDQALRIIEDEIRTLETILEHKRKGMPTAKQLHFLFRNEIPIPLKLTWGEASDMIEERMAQIEIEKEAKKEAKENARREQLKLALQGKALMPRLTDSDFPYHAGDKVIHPEHGKGIVERAGVSLASVQFESGQRMIPVTDIKPEGRDS